MNNKIGIMTLYYKNNNYGGVAQAYALNKYFINLGYDSELISYNKEKSDLNLVNKNKNVKMIAKRCFNKAKKIMNKTIEKKLEKNYSEGLRMRADNLENFRNSIPHSKVYDSKNINEIAEKYDIFVTGSDQVWNPGVINNAYVFSFLDSKNIFSYASSLAVTEVTNQYIDFMKKELKKYNHISVREQQSKEILEKAIEKKVEWVVDPTLLLERKEWDSLLETPLIEDKYIFSYMIGDSKEQRKKIKEFSKKKNLKLVTIPYIKNGNKFEFRIEDYRFGDKQMLDITFENFLNLIKNAEYIITDSFHAVCFSYIFKKEFYVFEKESLISTSSRIYSLLELFGTLNRIIKNKIPTQDNFLDYNKIDENILPMIEQSKKYIQTALYSNKEGK